MTVRSVDVLGLSIEAHTVSTIVFRMEELIASEGCSVVFGVNAHSLNLTYRVPGYREALLRVDLLYADGASLVLAAGILGERLPGKLATSDIWPAFCRISERRGYRSFLLGGEPGLAESARAKTLEQYPDMQIVGAHHGYFEFASEEVLSLVNDAKPHVLWLGLGEPLQAFWADAVRARLRVPLVVLAGGLFKIVSGRLDRAPVAWCQAGFEWLYRMIREPGVWRRYAADLPLMAVRVLLQRLSGRSNPG